MALTGSGLRGLKLPTWKSGRSGEGNAAGRPSWILSGQRLKERKQDSGFGQGSGILPNPRSLETLILLAGVTRVNRKMEVSVVREIPVP